MSKHTPGPWDLDGDILITKADPFEEMCFGRLSLCGAFSEDEVAHTEALILAAPDLLEALEVMFQAFVFHGYTADSAVTVARAAIAKARGEG